MGKTFTLEEANRSLVFVAPVVKEIQTLWMELMTFKVNPTAEEFERYSRERTVREKLDRLKVCNGELAQVGCMLRDPIEGIVDFPSVHQEQEVFLCWRMGEEQADFWHPVEEGYDAHRVMV
ncbi:hypothetical protein A3J23_03775 [Candidatus Peregrinibacteria bacterium RIFCSPLOWO2_02_FULL_48_14]|nr:MAG: hypothetical protein A2974_00540 [Candidatus Peregrinibacteria bacterium RIFCSPLOWO2_01_FULL_48_20]OGJ45876.1 MAG: hypothetical protein A3J23_03775 [Candidatus Peregrinibacteria bacterium RIFCSPLOWO2_02_FULL_48_14]